MKNETQMDFDIPAINVGYIILVSRRSTTDPHLSIVLGFNKDQFQPDWRYAPLVTWYFNHQTGGFGHGNYYPPTEASEAFANYLERES